jgi:rhodanese-related sulfurtransferase
MPVPEITVQEARARLVADSPPRLIDVREADEWEIVHIAGAELLPLSQWPGISTEKLADPDEALLILCHHGGRSERAAAFLIRSGFTNVTNVAGGIDAWAVEVDPLLARY